MCVCVARFKKFLFVLAVIAGGVREEEEEEGGGGHRLNVGAARHELERLLHGEMSSPDSSDCDDDGVPVPFAMLLGHATGEDSSAPPSPGPGCGPNAREEREEYEVRWMEREEQEQKRVVAQRIIQEDRERRRQRCMAEASCSKRSSSPPPDESACSSKMTRSSAPTATSPPDGKAAEVKAASSTSISIPPRTTTEEAVVKELLTAIECPVCYKPNYFGSLKGCRNGHFVCPDCGVRLQECPVCKNPDMTNVNLAVQNMRDVVMRDRTVPCANSVYGCDTLGLYQTVKRHVLECIERPVKCARCSFFGTFGHMEEHCKRSSCMQTIKCLPLPPDAPQFYANADNFTVVCQPLLPCFSPQVFPLLGGKERQLLLHLVLAKDTAGRCLRLYVRSLAKFCEIKKFGVKMSVFPAASLLDADEGQPQHFKSQALSSAPKYVMVGGLVHGTAPLLIPPTQIPPGGSLLTMDDVAVRALQMGHGGALFVVVISVFRKTVTGDIPV